MSFSIGGIRVNPAKLILFVVFLALSFTILSSVIASMAELYTSVSSVAKDVYSSVKPLADKSPLSTDLLDYTLMLEEIGRMLSNKSVLLAFIVAGVLTLIMVRSS